MTESGGLVRPPVNANSKSGRAMRELDLPASFAGFDPIAERDARAREPIAFRVKVGRGKQPGR